MINSLRATRNGLLQRLPGEDLDRVERRCRPARFEAEQVLAMPGRKLDGVWFPESGFASVIVGTQSQGGVEIGLIGREGAIGYITALGVAHSVHRVVVQQEGTAHVVPADELPILLDEAPRLGKLIACFAAAMMIQIGDTASANARGRVLERLARWLLMAHDRSDGDTLNLVHRYLAAMLGVRRAGITDALHTLEGQGLIRAERGRITIRDRQGLAEVANGFYGFAERSYAQIMGPAPSRMN